MTVFNGVVMGIAIVIAVLFSLVVFITGKGDAMSGGGGVRTSFKGKASFEDTMAKITLYMGIGFMALMLVLDVLSNFVKKG